jgi:hypothetical protein
MTIKVPKDFPKYLESVKEQPEYELTHKTISISKENYDKMIEMGNMKTSFNDIVTDLMKKADAESEADEKEK